jgi:hypothetical protein
MAVNSQPTQKSQAIHETKRDSERQDTLWEDEPILGMVTSARGEFVLKSIDTETVSARSQTSKLGIQDWDIPIYGNLPVSTTRN